MTTDETKNLNLLNESIEHWQRMVADPAGKEEPGCFTCPLCLEYNNERHMCATTCLGCPIMEDTSKKGCAGTPYQVAEDLHYELEAEETDIETVRKAYRAELDYLVGLRAKLTKEGKS